MLSYFGIHVLVNVFDSDPALVLVLERDIRSRPFLVVNRDADSSCIGNGIELE